MSTTKGGVTGKVLTGRTAASLQRYRDSVEEGQEPYLYAATRHCSHDAETQIAEWKAVREQHGTQGARRAAKASYETVDPETGLHASGQRGTHVKHFDGKRYRKRHVRDGEMPTHLRVEPEDRTIEKESEATHTIWAAGADLVNPDSPDDMQRFFEAVKAERDEHYPGLQESMWLERNGKSGLVHVHVASNATVYRDFALDGVEYRAGQKMSGDLTKVDAVRRRFEKYLDAHPEHGFRQSLARVGTDEYDAAQRRDGQVAYWEKKRGKESSRDRIRRTAVEALGAQHVADHDGFVAEMRSRGVEVSQTGLRRGKPGKNHDYAYRVEGAKQAVKGRTLGVDFSHAAIGAQLELKAAGCEIERGQHAQGTGPARPLPFELKPLSDVEERELEQLRADVERLAEEERSRAHEERTARAQLEGRRKTFVSRPERSAAEPDDAETDETAVRSVAEAAPRRESQLRGFTAYKGRDLLVVDRGLRVRDGRRALDVQLDARDPAARDQSGLHLSAEHAVVPGRPEIRLYSPEHLDAIRRSAGQNVEVLRDERGRETGRVYGVHGDLKPSVHGGLVMNENAEVSKSSRPVGADWQERQRGHEDRVRETRKVEKAQDAQSVGAAFERKPSVRRERQKDGGLAH